MKTISDFDRTASAWLVDGPTELSDRVLDAALREVHLTPQRRGLSALRRFTPVLRAAALAAAIVVIAAGGIILIGGGRGPAASPSPSTPARATTASTAAPTTGSPAPQVSMSPLSTTFASPWYGYSVKYPAGWQATPGQGPWPIGTNLRHLDPHLDEVKGPVGTQMARIVGASVALPAGMGLEGFMGFASGGTCEPVEPLHEPVVIDGIQATVTLNGCTSLSELHGLIWDVVLVAGGRGYDFTIDGFVTAAEAQAWLDSIKLAPSAATSTSPRP